MYITWNEAKRSVEINAAMEVCRIVCVCVKCQVDKISRQE